MGKKNGEPERTTVNAKPQGNMIFPMKLVTLEFENKFLFFLTDSADFLNVKRTFRCKFNWGFGTVKNFKSKLLLQTVDANA